MAILRGEEARQYIQQHPNGGYEILSGGTGGEDQTLSMVKNILSTGVNNADLNDRLMEIVMNKLLAPDPETQIRDEIAARILESDTPDLDAYRKLKTPGTNLDEILGGGEKTETQTKRDLEIEKARKKGNSKLAKQLSGLSDDDYIKYKSGGYRLI